jgi:hypothetical protein
MDKCPQCGENYQQLGQHWYYSPSHRPELTEKQIEITTGLLMGDGSVGKDNKNHRLQTAMISPNYLEYLDNIFGVLGCGVSLKNTAAESAKSAKDDGFDPNAKEENYSDVYRWQTRKHPKFNEFRKWYANGKKVWPEDIELTPTVLKHWYVGDGHYKNDGYKNCISIGMANEVENTEKISKYFTNVNLPEPSNYTTREGKYGKQCEAQWTVEDSNTLWKYMGEPLPDFKYKWPEEYR